MGLESALVALGYKQPIFYDKKYTISQIGHAL